MQNKRTHTIRALLPAMLIALLGMTSMPIPAQGSSLEQSMARNSRALGTELVMRGQPRGARLLRQVALQGDPKAQYNLAVAYMREMSVAAQPEVALRWFRAAASAGYAAAAYNAGVLHANNRISNASPVYATYWMCRAANMRHSGALRWLYAHRNGAASCSN